MDRLILTGSEKGKNGLNDHKTKNTGTDVEKVVNVRPGIQKNR